MSELYIQITVSDIRSFCCSITFAAPDTFVHMDSHNLMTKRNSKTNPIANLNIPKALFNCSDYLYVETCNHIVLVSCHKLAGWHWLGASICTPGHVRLLNLATQMAGWMCRYLKLWNVILLKKPMYLHILCLTSANMICILSAYWLLHQHISEAYGRWAMGSCRPNGCTVVDN